MPPPSNPRETGNGTGDFPNQSSAAINDVTNKLQEQKGDTPMNANEGSFANK